MKKRKKLVKKKPTPAKRLPCSCEFDKGIVAMFEESLEKLRSLGPEPMEHFNNALMHSDAFHHMLHVMCEGEADPAYIMSDLYRMGVEAGKRTAECQSLEKMVGLS